MSENSTLPAAVSQRPSEDLPWGVDVSALIPAPTVVEVESVILTQEESGTVVNLADQPSVEGRVVRQRVRAGVLTLGLNYILTFRVSPENSTNVLEVELKIRCK